MARMKIRSKAWSGCTVVVLFSALFVAACAPRAERLPADQLQIRINLLCTTCDDFLQCRAEPDSESVEFTLYRLREKTFWAQVATIWDYLIQSIRPKTADTRPLSIYRQQAVDGQIVRQTLQEGERARVDMVTGMISLPDSRIDMRNGEWRDLRGEVNGFCSAMTRREGYAWIRSLLGRTS